MASCSYNVSSKAKTDESDNHLFALMAVKITALLDKSDYLVVRSQQKTYFRDRGFHISIGAKFDPKLTPPSNIYWKELIGAVGLVLIISILVAGVYTYKQGYWDRWLKKEQTNNGNVERLITTQSDPANGNGNGLTDINPSISRFDSVFN
uniref:Uncharacterized protein n=1 Tax=Caenorhabditis japonica TaxID=281687 RepID=A0A8R1HGD3_CAEJA